MCQNYGWLPIVAVALAACSSNDSLRPNGTNGGSPAAQALALLTSENYDGTGSSCENTDDGQSCTFDDGAGTTCTYSVSADGGFALHGCSGAWGSVTCESDAFGFYCSNDGEACMETFNEEGDLLESDCADEWPEDGDHGECPEDCDESINDDGSITWACEWPEGSETCTFYEDGGYECSFVGPDGDECQESFNTESNTFTTNCWDEGDVEPEEPVIDEGMDDAPEEGEPEHEECPEECNETVHEDGSVTWQCEWPEGSESCTFQESGSYECTFIAPETGECFETYDVDSNTFTTNCMWDFEEDGEYDEEQEAEGEAPPPAP